MTVASIFTPNLNKTQPVEPSVEPALTVTSHARNTFEIKNLSSHQEMRQNLKRPTQTSILRTPEETRAIKLRTTLDRDLRKYFGFGKRSFKSIVKKPGNKLGFKLSSYIAPTDSISTVNEILLSIAQHREYTKVSPVKEVFNTKFKEELRANFFQRHPKKYLIKLHLGVTLLYKTKEGIEKVDTNRNLHTNSIQYMSPKEIKSFTSTFPIEIRAYHGQNKEQYDNGVGGTGPHAVFNATSEGLQQVIDSFVGTYKVLDSWLEVTPTVIEHTAFTKDQFIELQDERLERASVLSDNFVKYAGGIHVKAQQETDGKCVETQLLEFFLNPNYTDPINKIPTRFGSDDLQALDAASLRTYLDSLPKAPNEGEGFSTRQLAFMCADLKLNMYALDQDSKCFLKVTQFECSRIWPKGQSGNVRHHPLVFYAFNKHIYLIVHQECIKSIAETCKDAIDSRSFKKPMR